MILGVTNDVNPKSKRAARKPLPSAPSLVSTGPVSAVPYPSSGEVYEKYSMLSFDDGDGEAGLEMWRWTGFSVFWSEESKDDCIEMREDLDGWNEEQRASTEPPYIPPS